MVDVTNGHKQRKDIWLIIQNNKKNENGKMNLDNHEQQIYFKMHRSRQSEQIPHGIDENYYPFEVRNHILHFWTISLFNNFVVLAIEMYYIWIV